MSRSYTVECWRCETEISAAATYCQSCGEVQLRGGSE